MNEEIAVMVELQRYWDGVMRGEGEVRKAGAAIAEIENNVRKRTGDVETAERNLMAMKSSLKQKEIDLAECDEHIRKLDGRMMQVTTEKEVRALRNEMDGLKEQRGALEEAMILLMDEIGAAEKDLEKMRLELEEASGKGERDRAMLTERIRRFEGTIGENRGRFEDNCGRLSTQSRPRFRKLIESANGTAIAEIEGKICGGCRMELPGHTVMDVVKNGKLMTCSRCGRYLYDPNA